MMAKQVIEYINVKQNKSMLSEGVMKSKVV